MLKKSLKKDINFQPELLRHYSSSVPTGNWIKWACYLLIDQQIEFQPKISLFPVKSFGRR
ncbi:hypothetical protein AYI68_g2586, partial [Smittium mucronatum]